MATSNRGKVKEVEAILALDPRFDDIDVLTLAEAGAADFEYDETADTFADNAVGKAVAAASRTGLAAIADDSGLCVDALGGEPGVYSARWAGESATDDERNRRLLDRLIGVPEAQRTARFVSVMAIALPSGKNYFAEGTCEGRITSESRGNGGFGYDPIFFSPEFSRTFAELTAAEKNAISHRGAAISKLAAGLADFLAESTLTGR